MIEHKDQILSRPKRVWFQSNSDRQEAKGEYSPVNTCNYYLKTRLGRRINGTVLC